MIYEKCFYAYEIYGYFIQFHHEEWNIFQLELVCYYLFEDVCLFATMKIISKGKWNGG